MAGGCRNVVHRSLNDLERTFNSTVQHGHGVAEASGVFKTFEDGAEALEGVVVVQQSLSERFFGEASSQTFGFLDVSERLFVRFGQRGRFFHQG